MYHARLILGTRCKLLRSVLAPRVEARARALLQGREETNGRLAHERTHQILGPESIQRRVHRASILQSSCLVRKAGLEPARIAPRDPKSRASTSSATPATSKGQSSTAEAPSSSTGLHPAPQSVLKEMLKVSDPRLAEVVARWGELPEPLRLAILAIVGTR